MTTRTRSTGAPPPRARATDRVMPPPGRPLPPPTRFESDQAKNLQRMEISYAMLLESRRTDPALLLPLMKAFGAIRDAATFAAYMKKESSWKNPGYVFDWMSRALAPAMMVRPIAEEVRDSLRSKSLTAGVDEKMFAERYFFELSLYCDAVIAQKDISFIFGQATQIMGPLLAPVMAAVSAAAPAAVQGVNVAATAVSGTRAGVNFGLKKGLQKNLPDKPTYATIPANSKPDDPMRFTLAWLDFVTTETEPTEAIATIHAEFGGLRGCTALYEWLKTANL